MPLSLRLAAASFVLALPLAAAGIPESAYQDLHWRLVGPLRAGWAPAVAGVPGAPATFYFGGADGGVFRTDDAGVTWRPLFESGGSASIGALAVSPSDPQVVWIGTGQVHQRWDIVSGDGVYRSTDGGATWKHLGLAATAHIGDLWVDPRDADVAVVAALGHVFGPNEERGLYRTEDGGSTWRRVFYRDADTGATDLAGDPRNPDRLYAALWQVRRHPWLDYFQPPVGPGTGLLRSTDGGRSWSPCGTEGFPEGPLGRIALAVLPGSGGRSVDAAIEGKGLYRSDDGGSTWSQLSPDGGLVNSYMSLLIADPQDPQILWAGGRSLRRSTDGGKSFAIAKGSPGGDDYHALWIDPTDRRRMITGADQGAVVTLNGGETWSSWYNQPTGQFYRLAADDRFPYWIYSGQQDNGTVGIASRSDYGQLTFRDWHPVGGDERDGDVPDPADPDIVYGAGLGGRLSKWNRRTGQVQNVAPWPVGSYAARPGTTRYRYGWITPLAIAKRPPHAIYLGAQVLFRSTDGGASWATVSPDLTGAVEGAPDCGGDVPVERATACGYGVIFTIAPSSAADGVVWVGTDNGRVQLTRDDGATWSDVTPPSLGDWSKINTIDPSPRDPAVAYVAADRHRLDDARPLVYRTRDFGVSWTEIGNGLPAGEWVGAVRQDAERDGLLFAGTNRGVYVSFDDGASWGSLRRDLPTTGINDLLVHGDDLVAATEGRGLWALDGIEPLRHLTADLVARSRELPALLPSAAAYRLRANSNRDTPLPPEEPRAPNPPVGALVDYLVPAGWSGALAIEIADLSGAVLRRFASDAEPEPIRTPPYFAPLWQGLAGPLAATPGHHRLIWDLRTTAPEALRQEWSMAALPGRPMTALPQGALVVPGEYEVRLVAGDHVERQRLRVRADPRVPTSLAELAALAAFQREVENALGRSAKLATDVDETAGRLRKASSEPRAGRNAGRLAAALRELEALTSGETSPRRLHGELTELAIDLGSADAPPTAPQRELLDEVRAGLDGAERSWSVFAAGTLRRLERPLARLAPPAQAAP